jgi:hypothetical protein
MRGELSYEISRQDTRKIRGNYVWKYSRKVIASLKIEKDTFWFLRCPKI